MFNNLRRFVDKIKPNFVEALLRPSKPLPSRPIGSPSAAATFVTPSI